MLVALDGTILLIAQPSLQHDLGASPAQVQWTSTGYLLAVTSLLVVAGRLGDRYGHARLLLIGVLGFGASSAGIALAPSVGWVIGLRVTQGVSGALLQPATLALLRLAYAADRLGTPVAIRTSSIGVAAGAGPVLGGVLVAQWGWRAVFWINVPLSLLIVALTLASRLPVPVRSRSQPLELRGAALLTATLAVLVHTLACVPARGWTAPPTVLGLLAVACLAGLFTWYERRTTHPLVPHAVARSLPVTAAMAILLITTAGLFGTLFTATFYLQDVLRLNALSCGLHVLPLTVLMVLGAPVAATALRHFSPRRCATAGTTLVVMGIAALSRSGPTSTWVVMGSAFAVLGAGFATIMVTATGTVVGDAPPGYAGVVGGLKQTAMNIGPTLGIAIAAATGASAIGNRAAPAPVMGPTLLVLAAVTALGLLPAILLPSHPPQRAGTDTTETIGAPGQHEGCAT
ncbi:MFS transporter [Streptomyces sp. NPDC050738]|uniref:MFS transporter n=1 Tax=Streptomyces sp. NPDC050738 TaxID=3154744 RepID=UPI00341E5EE7